jgi:hypothetical protein
MDARIAHSAAEIAPITGIYELLNPGGATATPVRVPVFEGTTFPPVPPGWLWRLAGTRLPAAD